MCILHIWYVCTFCSTLFVTKLLNYNNNWITILNVTVVDYDINVYKMLKNNKM